MPVTCSLMASIGCSRIGRLAVPRSRLMFITGVGRTFSGSHSAPTGLMVTGRAMPTSATRSSLHIGFGPISARSALLARSVVPSSTSARSALNLQTGCMLPDRVVGADGRSRPATRTRGSSPDSSSASPPPIRMALTVVLHRILPTRLRMRPVRLGNLLRRLRFNRGLWSILPCRRLPIRSLRRPLVRIVPVGRPLPRALVLGRLRPLLAPRRRRPFVARCPSWPRTGRTGSFPLSLSMPSRSQTRRISSISPRSIVRSFPAGR